MDWVEGKVTGLAGCVTLEVSVSSGVKRGCQETGGTARVRVAGIDRPESGSTAYSVLASRLKAKFQGKTVHCDILGRDSSGSLVCSVRIVRPKKT